MGYLADKYRRPRLLMFWAMPLVAASFYSLAAPAPMAGAAFAWRCASFWALGFFSSAFSVVDALAIAASASDMQRWGRARVWGAVGWGIMHVVFGPIMDKYGFVVNFVAFGICLAAFGGTLIKMPSACGTVHTEVNVSAALAIFRKNWNFLVNLVFLGAGFSMVEGMLFLLLVKMEASVFICGLSVGVTVVFELPIFHYAQPILDRLGVRRMVLLAQAAWVLRAAYYAMMPSAWMVILIEPLHGVTFALAWTAATRHMANRGAGLEATSQALMNLCFMGLGSFLGLTVGGWLFERFDHMAYALFAVVIGVSGVVYAFLSRGDPEQGPGPGPGLAVPLMPSTTLGTEADVEN